MSDRSHQRFRSILSSISQQFSPDRELDELLATHVMGWTYNAIDADGPYWCTTLSDNSGQIVMKVVDWKPSINHDQAMQVLEACTSGLSRDRAGWFSGTAIRATGTHHWEIALSENEMGPLESIHANTLPLAIARAAVAWALWQEIKQEVLERRKNQHFHPMAVHGTPFPQQIQEERR